MTRKAVVCFVLLAFGGLLRAEFRLSDQESEVYYEFAVVAGEAIQVEKDARVTGDVHSNGTVLVKKDALVTGDVSAAGEVSLVGTVTGEVTPGAVPLVLPALELAALRDRADRVFEGDTTFDDHVVIDDVVFVDGTVHFRGSVNGSGTVAATGDVRLDTVGGKMGFVLEETTRLSFVAGGDVRLGKGRPMRGVIRAGHDAQLETATVFEGVIVADHQVLVKKASAVTFVDFDQVAPVITLVSPQDGSVLATATPEVRAEIVDDFSGLDLESLKFVLDGMDLTAEVVFEAGVLSFAPSVPLADGAHTVLLAISDRAGNAAEASAGFLVATSVPAPEVTVVTPGEGAIVNTPTLTVSGTIDALVPLDRVIVNGEDATFDDTGFSRPLDLDPGFNAILVVATDVFGNQGVATRSVTLDTEPPAIVLDSPSAELLTNEAGVRVSGRASDDSGLASIEVGALSVPVGDGSFDEHVALAEGLNAITVRSVDLAGNAAEVTVEVRRLSVPTLVVTAPKDLALVAADTVDVEGTVSDPAALVRANGIDAEVSGGQFVARDVPLEEGRNLLDVLAVNTHGAASSAKVTVMRDLTPPRVVIYEPADGAVVHEAEVSVRGLVNDLVTGAVATEPVAVTVNGLPARVSNQSFLLDSWLLEPGVNTITVDAEDASGNTSSWTVEVAFEPLEGPAIRAVSGGLQSARIGETLPEPLVAVLVDGEGNPVEGEPVVFRVRGNNGRLEGGRRQLVVTSGVDGRAAAGFTLGTRAGVGNQRVEASAAGFAGPAVFLATALSGEPAHLYADSGAQQTGAAGQVLPDPLVAVVTDEGFNRLAGVPVLFEVVRGAGTFAESGLGHHVVETDANGRALAELRLDPKEGVANNVVEASLLDDPGVRFATFVASGRAVGDPALTSIRGLVLDNTDEPVPGVTVRLHGTPISTRTDETGAFHVAGAPVGTLLLEVAGSTASRPGTWPTLEFELTTIAGRDNTLGRPIYLLPLDVERGLAVSETEGGTLGLPELPGFSLEVAPGSVTFPDGSREGVVSATAVHFDKVPMVPNFGQQPFFVITIQPSGARFDPPARLTLPNVEGLGPGEVTEMYSFDHDLGRFVGIGPGTVSEDGMEVVSDLGVGVLEAGWHCGGNPILAGTPHDCPQCRICDGSTCVPDQLLISLAKAGGCSDGSRCTENDTCQDDGTCRGWPISIDEMTARANGEVVTETIVGKPVQFDVANVKHQHCPESVRGYKWRFGDGSTSALKSPKHAYSSAGSRVASVTVDCKDGCDNLATFALVHARCPTVRIIGSDPDINELCPGCQMKFLIETDPPDEPVIWDIVPGTDLDGAAFVSEDGVLSIASDARREGRVTVRVRINEDSGFFCPNGEDKRSIHTFVSPDLPRDEDGFSVAENLWQDTHFLCAALVHRVAREARRARSRNFSSCDQDLNQGVPNAFYHAFGNCYVSAICGEASAKQLFDAHEQYDTNNCQDAAMDFHNNKIGRDLGAGASADDCSGLVVRAIKEGRLRWMDPPPTPGECPEFQSELSEGSPCLPPE